MLGVAELGAGFRGGNLACIFVAVLQAIGSRLRRLNYTTKPPALSSTSTIPVLESSPSTSIPELLRNEPILGGYLNQNRTQDPNFKVKL